MLTLFSLTACFKSNVNDPNSIEDFGGFTKPALPRGTVFKILDRSEGITFGVLKDPNTKRCYSYMTMVGPDVEILSSVDCSLFDKAVDIRSEIKID